MTRPQTPHVQTECALIRCMKLSLIAFIVCDNTCSLILGLFFPLQVLRRSSRMERLSSQLCLVFTAVSQVSAVQTCEISHSINERGSCKGYTADVESVDLTGFISITLTSHQNENPFNLFVTYHRNL